MAEADCIVLRFGGGRAYVVQADELEIVALPPDVASAGAVLPAISLDALLHEDAAPASDTREHWLRVSVGGTPHWLHTRASLDVVALSTDAFFRLPAVIRACASASWVRGIVLLSAAPSAIRERGMALWIELAAIPL